MEGMGRQAISEGESLRQRPRGLLDVGTSEVDEPEWQRLEQFRGDMPWEHCLQEARVVLPTEGAVGVLNKKQEGTVRVDHHHPNPN